jgi:hypothetical protein
VVASVLPFHCATEDDTNLEPLTVRVNCGPPAFVLLGESDVPTGTGLTTPVPVKVTD